LAALSGLGAIEQSRVDGSRARAGDEIRLAVADPAVSAEAGRCLDARQVPIAAIELRQPSLDDVFLALTGRPTDDPRADQPLAPEAA
jgi:hypothetical protein